VLGDLLIALAANLAVHSDRDASRAGRALVESEYYALTIHGEVAAQPPAGLVRFQVSRFC
jgi:hypothetical protein